jgi:tRNA (mo5U34)-methyltransferase
MFQFLQFHCVSLNRHYTSLLNLLTGHPGLAWLLPLIEESDVIVQSGKHGDLPEWKNALANLPVSTTCLDGAQAAPVLGHSVSDPDALKNTLMKLHPWRKGPLRIGGVLVDTEWRSDMKWERLSGQLDLRGHRVLDIGCGNGYYGWRMLGDGADFVIGIDPTLVFVMQWLAARHFAGNENNFVLPLGIEQLPMETHAFDSVFSMGVLYHRKDPVHHLQHLAGLARPGGTVVLETLITQGGGLKTLVPQGRYARMRNVWAVPSLDQLLEWVRRAGLAGVRILDVSPTRNHEQRSTDWMRFESLRDCLDPGDNTLTIEGYPAPVRAALLAKTPV